MFDNIRNTPRVPLPLLSLNSPLENTPITLSDLVPLWQAYTSLVNDMIKMNFEMFQKGLKMRRKKKTIEVDLNAFNTRQEPLKWKKMWCLFAICGCI